MDGSYSDVELTEGQRRGRERPRTHVQRDKGQLSSLDESSAPGRRRYTSSRAKHTMTFYLICNTSVAELVFPLSSAPVKTRF